MKRRRATGGGQAARTRLRRARSNDAEAVLALEKNFASDRMSRRSVRALLKSPAARVYVAETVPPAGTRSPATVVAALIFLTRRGSGSARIYSVAVAPQARGQGLGRRLVQQAEREARRLGCATMGLEVRLDNAAARALYHGLGYTELATLPGYYEDGADGVRLRRRLRPGRRY